MISRRCVVILSGKRKSGKDYVAELLHEKLTGSVCSILRLSHPLKRQYAELHGLELEKLLDSSPYKEQYRADMIKWGEEMRAMDPYIFVGAITSSPESDRIVWVVSDARRTSDIECFKALYPDCVIVVRIVADDKIRIKRGWKFTQGIDDAESECGLDSFPDFDLYIANNNGELQAGLETLIKKINAHIS